MKIQKLIRELKAGTHILIAHDHESRHYDGYLWRIERVTPSAWRIYYGRHTRTVSTDSHIDAHIIRRYRA